MGPCLHFAFQQSWQAGWAPGYPHALLSLVLLVPRHIVPRTGSAAPSAIRSGLIYTKYTTI